MAEAERERERDELEFRVPTAAQALRLAIAIARQWRARDERLDRADVDSAAGLACAEALLRYDPLTGPFEAYLALLVRGRCGDTLRERVGRLGRKPIPDSLDHELQRYSDGDQDARADYGRLDFSCEDVHPADHEGYADYVTTVEEWDRPQLHYTLHALLRGAERREMWTHLRVTETRVSQLVAELRRDWRCWAELEPCGKRACPRCSVERLRLRRERWDARHDERLAKARVRNGVRRERERELRAALPPAPPRPREPRAAVRPAYVRRAEYMAREERAGRSITLAREARDELDRRALNHRPD